MAAPTDRSTPTGSTLPPDRRASPHNALIVIELNAVVVAVTDDEPRILTVRRAHHALATPALKGPSHAGAPTVYALPFGPFDPDDHQTLDRGLRRWVEEQTGLRLGYVEQLYTFGDRYRDPRELWGGPRVVGVGYLALVREDQPAGSGVPRWQSCYTFLPWEDWRNGRPDILDTAILPALDSWIDAAPHTVQSAGRRERVAITFGLDAGWDSERVLERYELLYEAGLVAESQVDRAALSRHHAGHGAEPEPVSGVNPVADAGVGRPMALDHRRILATALGRARGKIRYRPVVFELLSADFTLLQLQLVVEALAGMRLHKQNFRRIVTHAGLVEPIGRRVCRTGGRPAQLFRFRREVLRERQSPGVGLPTARPSD